MPQYERRLHPSSALEIREADSGALVIGGNAIVFDSTTELFGFQERVDPDVQIDFANDDVFSLFNHNWDRVLGRMGAGTLELARDGGGLRAETTLADTVSNRDLMASIQRGDIAGQSFGFDILSEEWDTSGDMPLSTLRHIRLYEVTVTPIPAYPATDIEVQARSRLERFQRERQESDLSMARLEWAQLRMKSRRRK